MINSDETGSTSAPGSRREFLGNAALLGAALSLPFGATAQQVKRGGTLRIGVGFAVAKLNPLHCRVTPEYLVAELLYSGLTRLGPALTPVPDLAESWSSNAELTEWTFKLRNGLTFHDGSACTADDVAASIEAMLDAKTASPARQNIGPIATVTTKGPQSVVLKLSAPYADMPTVLAFPNAKIVPAAILKKGGLARLDREAVGTGPFKLVSFEPERLISVVRNPAYYDKDRPYLDKVEVRVYPDATAEGSALISGDIDAMALVQPTEFGRLKSNANVVAMRAPSGQFVNINMGCNQKPFNDVRVRRALALTVDRKTMVDFVAEGYGTVANDVPINAAYPFFKDLPAKKQDIAQAKKLLAEAGYPNGIDLTLIASDVPQIRTQMGVALRQMAKPAGFNINVQTMPHSTYLEQVWKKGNFYVGFYNPQPTADAVFSLLYTSTASWNETHWNNAAFDKLIKEAQGTADKAKRTALYAEAQKLMNDEVPSIIPVFFDLLRARRKYVQGYDVHPRGLVFRLDYVSLGEGAPKRA